MGSQIKCVVGLGNPGKKYRLTRHNLGFLLVDAQLAALATKWRKQFQGELAQVPDTALPTYWFKPQTFMNLSGEAVRPLLHWLKMPTHQMLVVHDELDLPAGQLKLKLGGGSGGHNGLKSIIDELGSGDFWRLRLGIGKPGSDFNGDSADYVLDPLPDELQHDLVEKGLSALELIFTQGPTAAMQQLNRSAEAPK